MKLRKKSLKTFEVFLACDRVRCCCWRKEQFLLRVALNTFRTGSPSLRPSERARVASKPVWYAGSLREESNGKTRIERLAILQAGSARERLRCTRCVLSNSFDTLAHCCRRPDAAAHTSNPVLSSLTLLSHSALAKALDAQPVVSCSFYFWAYHVSSFSLRQLLTRHAKLHAELTVWLSLSNKFRRRRTEWASL